MLNQHDNVYSGLETVTNVAIEISLGERTGHSPNNVLGQPVEKLSFDENSTVRFNTIKRFETELMDKKMLLLSGLMITSTMRVTFLKCRILMCFLF